MKRRPAARGKALEAELRAYHATFGPDAPRMGRLHAAERLGKAAADFSGLLPDGRVVLVEAKEITAVARFPLKYLQPHQTAALRAVHQAGGLAVLVVRVGRDTWALGYPALEGALVRWSLEDKASLSPGELDRCGAKLEGVAWWGRELPKWSGDIGLFVKSEPEEFFEVNDE